jgi:malyl-CoA/(S)-citramalyl-CoA lyase
MSFRLQPAPVARPNRCQLFGPGSRTALFEKMAASAADVINLDLEDSVAPGTRISARANVIAATHDVDWGRKTCRCGSTASIRRFGTAMWWTCWNRGLTGWT